MPPRDAIRKELFSVFSSLCIQCFSYIYDNGFCDKLHEINQHRQFLAAFLSKRLKNEEYRSRNFRLLSFRFTFQVNVNILR